jgi:hypothetical protein
VLDAILGLDHFPAGMELFPASDATPWEVIQRVIDESDYYILLVGGKYGSIDEAGVSYTEREYDYATKRGIPVLPFLVADPDSVPVGKSESSSAARRKLAAFRTKVEQHHCKYWSGTADLKYKVVIGLVQEINVNPGVGWVRANELSVGSRSAELEEAQREIDLLQSELAKVDSDLSEARLQLSELSQREALSTASAAQAAGREARAVEQLEELRKKIERLTSVDDGPDDAPFAIFEDSIEDAFNGNPHGLMSFAIWSSTPQGHEFWSEEHKLLQAGKPMTTKARKALQAMLDDDSIPKRRDTRGILDG